MCAAVGQTRLVLGTRQPKTLLYNIHPKAMAQGEIGLNLHGQSLDYFHVNGRMK